MHRQLRAGLTIFATFSTVGLLLSAYRYLEFVANREHVNPLEPFINEMSGAWTAALLYPLLTWFARRYPIHRNNFATRLPVHAAALLTFSATHLAHLGSSPAVVSAFGARPL